MSDHLQYKGTHFTRNVNESIIFFKEKYLNSHVNARNILELGTKRWQQNKSTHHKEELKPWNSYVMSDVTEGQDVDVVADAHNLSSVFGEEKFDFLWSSSVFEHLHSPWIAAEEILKILKKGGVFYVQTHLCFPEHGYPNDYCRFTRMGLEHIFKNASKVISSYEYPATLTPTDPTIEWNKAAPVFLNVNIAGVK